MKNQKLPYLLDRYLNKSCSAEELVEFYALVNDPANELEFDDLLNDAIDKSPADEKLSPAEKSAVLQHIFSYEPANVVKLRKPALIFKRLAIAAAAVLLIAAGATYFIDIKTVFTARQDQTKISAARNAIKPGENKATLTLGNGAVIDLKQAANGKLADLANITITKTEDGQLVYNVNESNVIADKKNGSMNTLTTPRGGQYQVNLPDGTRVWLNAASSLKFPATFAGMANRRVELSGEGYFEVAKMDVPFLVSTIAQEIQVLGTHFNVNAYSDEANTKTTLLEGSVKVISNSGTDQATLKPGQEAVLTNSTFKIHQVDLEKSTDWKNGKFIFKNESLEGIMRKISRWYDVDVVYKGEAPTHETFSGTVSRFDQVDKFLRRLELTGEVSFKIEGRIIQVSK